MIKLRKNIRNRYSLSNNLFGGTILTTNMLANCLDNAPNQNMVAVTSFSAQFWRCLNRLIKVSRKTNHSFITYKLAKKTVFSKNLMTKGELSCLKE